MAKCIQCAGAAKSKDPVNGFSYCGIQCQREHYLIGDGLCRNEDDSDTFTMESFAEMDKRDIIVINDFCYHLPSLYTWVFRGPGKEHGRHPLTRARFDPDELEQLQATAKERYPLVVTVDENGENVAPIVTTSLSSLDDFIALVLGNHGFHNMPLTTRREFATALVTPATVVIFNMRNGESLDLITLLRRTVTVGRVFSPGDVSRVFIRRLDTPYDRTINADNIIFYIRTILNLPVSDAILHAKKAYLDQVSLADRSDVIKKAVYQRVRAHRERHDATRGPPPQDPSIRRIDIYINTDAGRVYGMFPIYVPIDSRLSDLMPYILRELNNTVPLANGPFGFISGGVMWPNEKLISDFGDQTPMLFMVKHRTQ